MAAKNKSNEISITRAYEAPVKAVWEAWTDPKQAAKWWGPRGFTLTTHSKDLRPGGSWVYTMHGPDGTDYENNTVYFEVEKYARLVYDHGANATQPPLFRVEVDFSENKGRTTMAMKMIFSDEQTAKESLKFIKAAGGNSTWDRLAEFLEKESTGKDQFVINRSFKAPIEKMFQMWTDPKHFEKWLPPVGFTMKFLRSEIKAGGSTFYVMSDGAGMEMYGRTEYLEISRPSRLVYTQQFCDKNEKISRHPGAPTWPETMLTKVELTAEGEDETRVTVTWAPYGKTTDEEVAACIKARAGMTQGWTGSFDKLDDYLSGQ
jgi:uncharacterized protein YndB with AHSA1/START domain